MKQIQADIMIDRTISQNFNTLRALSLSFVVIGHYFKDIPSLWVLASYGLMVFSYSSSLFTTKKYAWPFNVRAFWLNKVNRLGVNLLVINIFAGILAVFIFKRDLWHWQTAFHFFGLTAFFEWMKIPVYNHLGGGRWFLTVLFLFYLLFPISARKMTARRPSAFAVLIVFVICYLLNTFYYPRPGMWLTISGFAFGLYKAKFNIEWSKPLSVAGTCAAAAMIVVAKFILKIDVLNFGLLFLFFIFSIAWVPKMHFPRVFNSVGAFLSKYFLEIYLIHGLLFIVVSGNRIIDLIISLLLIMIVAMFLRYISQGLKSIVKPGSKLQRT